MHFPLNFLLDALRQPRYVVLWMAYLVVLNLTSLWFFDQWLGKVVFGTLVICGVLITPLYLRFGYSKILGVAHVPWIPMMVYLWQNLPSEPSPLRTWLIILMASNAVSLVIDARDAWLFSSGRAK